MAPRLDHDQNQIIIVVSSLAGALFMLGVLGMYRYCTRARREFSYERVAHSLDEEEQAFKRTLEMQGDDIDELFGFAGEEDELRFDAAELEQIEMLERYRQNLVAASNAAAAAAPPPPASGISSSSSSSSNPAESTGSLKASSPNPSEAEELGGEAAGLVDAKGRQHQEHFIVGGAGKGTVEKESDSGRLTAGYDHDIDTLQ